MPESELEKFFGDLPGEDKQETDIFNEKTPETPAPDADGKETPAKGDEPPKNRRHRRLEAQLEVEREARIRAEALADARAERYSPQGDKSEVPAKWLRIYGDTPEAREAWTLQQEVLADEFAKVKEQTLHEVQQQRQQEAQEQRRYESLIDSELEEIEDAHNVDLTSDAPAARKARREFLEMVSALSPKDENGTITGFADFDATWNLYQLKRAQDKPDNSRQKELASRSMQQSGPVDTGKATQDAELDYLRSIGIRV